jgi:hypothetical protein
MGKNDYRLSSWPPSFSPEWERFLYTIVVLTKSRLGERLLYLIFIISLICFLVDLKYYLKAPSLGRVGEGPPPSPSRGEGLGGSLVL